MLPFKSHPVVSSSKNPNIEGFDNSGVLRHGSLYNYLTTHTRQLVAAIDFKFDVLKVFIYASFKTENESHMTTWAVLTLQNKCFYKWQDEQFPYTAAELSSIDIITGHSTK